MDYASNDALTATPATHFVRLFFAARKFLRWKMLGVPICFEIWVDLGVDQENTGCSLFDPTLH